MNQGGRSGHPLIHRGERYDIYALRLADGSCPAKKFLEEQLSPTERSTMITNFTKLGSEGAIPNRERFHKVENSQGVLEFKDHQVRLFACWAGPGRMFLLYGIRKKQNKLKKADIRRAEDMARYAKNQGR